MKNLRLLSAAVALMFVLGVAAFAGETSTPPCAPGDISTPPCATAQMVSDNSTAPGDISTYGFDH